MPPSEDVFGVKEFGRLVERGKVAYKQGRFQDAIQAWKGAQAADPSRRGEVDGYLAKASAKQAALHLERARQLELGGDAQAALAEYRQVMRLDLRDAALREKVAEKVRASERKAEALSMTALLSGGVAFGVLVLLALWYILFVLD